MTKRLKMLVLHKYFVRFISLFLTDNALRQLKNKLLLRRCYVKSIVHCPNDVFEKVYHIKDETWERMRIPAIYKMMLSCEIHCFHSEQNILRIQEAVVFNASDIVLSSCGAVWDKAERQDFSKIIPGDRNYIKHTNNDVFIVKYSNKKKVYGKCLSMLGVHADVWAHFLIQFLPKLYYAEESGLLSQWITVLLPMYKDKNIIQIVDMVLDKYTTVHRLEAEDDVEYVCEELMYMPTASVMANHLIYTSPFDIVIPSRVISSIQSNIVEPLLRKSSHTYQLYDKLYLPRTNALYRKTSNISEVDDFFRSQGFYFVEGSLMTLEEKAEIFSHAKIIAGPYSSAWINTIFCRGAKGLLLSNIPKSIETYYLSLAGEKNIQFLHVQGFDNDNDHQTDFYMPLERVKGAYNQLMNDDYK